MERMSSTDTAETSEDPRISGLGGLGSGISLRTAILSKEVSQDEAVGALDGDEPSPPVKVERSMSALVRSVSGRNANNRGQKSMLTALDVEGFIKERQQESMLEGMSKFQAQYKSVAFINRIVSMLASLDRIQVENALSALHRICAGPDTIDFLDKKNIETYLMPLLALDHDKYKKITISALYLMNKLVVNDMCAEKVRVFQENVGELEELVRSEDPHLGQMAAHLVCSLFQHPLAGLREEEVMAVPELVQMLLFLIESDHLEVRQKC